jgi:phosphoglycerate dehydrogenase-like enzyme
MDLLIVEPLDPEVVQWLESRWHVRSAPHLARDPLALRKATLHVRAMITPPSVAVDPEMLQAAPRLCAVGRLSAGSENVDVDACARAGVEVVRPGAASAQAEAEFAVGVLLQLLRRVPVRNAEGLLVGRELGSATVGLVGMPAAARPLVQLLTAFGASVMAYDPALHASDASWAACGARPVGLRDLFERCDAVCVLLSFFSRYRGLIGERYLSTCRPDQVLLSICHASVFDELALAEALASNRMAAAWLDSLEPGMLDVGRPLSRVANLQVSPRVASTTRESRQRAAWAVARRIDELLAAPTPARFRPTAQGVSAGPADGSASG